MIVSLKKPEKYLNKRVGEIENPILLENIGVISTHNKTFSAKSEDNIFLFYKEEVINLHVNTDLKNVVKSVFFRTKKRIDHDFYLQLVNDYGEASMMLKMNTVYNIEDYVGEEYIANTQQGETKSCTFEDDPLIIIWDKHDYTFSVHMDYENNTSFFIFEMK